MKLCNLVEIEENNKECVILKVKDNVKIDLIKLGCFNGDEEYIRLTKGSDHTCTIFRKNGTHFDWHWGIKGYTLVNDKVSSMGKLIQECIEEDFDIYIGENIKKINETLYIRSLNDVKDAHHNIKIMYWNNKDNNICVHKDNEYYKHFNSINSVKEHFIDLGYELKHKSDSIAKTGCIVEEYIINKVISNDYEI